VLTTRSPDCSTVRAGLPARRAGSNEDYGLAAEEDAPLTRPQYVMTPALERMGCQLSLASCESNEEIAWEQRIAHLKMETVAPFLPPPCPGSAIGMRNSAARGARVREFFATLAWMTYQTQAGSAGPKSGSSFHTYLADDRQSFRTESLRW